MKVCIIVPAHWEAIMGGSQYQAMLLIEHLLENYDVDITYLTTLSRAEFEPRGYRIVRFSDRSGLRRYGSFFDAARLYRALGEIEPDVIIQYVGCAHTGIAAYYAKRHNCRMYFRVTNDPQVEPHAVPWWKVHHLVERLFLEYGIRNAGRVLAQTAFQRDSLARNFGRDDATVFRNVQPVPADRERPRRRNQRVLWIANLKPTKNPGAFVDLARALSDRSDVRFVMIGRAMRDDAWTREVIDEIGKIPNLCYLGARSQEDVNRLLSRTNVLVNTSRFEGFSNTFIQAWMRRVPVVSLNADPDALLSRGGLGFVSGTQTQLVEDVRGLLDSPSLCQQIGARCRKYAVAHHALGRIDDIATELNAPRSVGEPASQLRGIAT